MARLLTYDLGSENNLNLKTVKAIRAVRSARVSCTQKLYRLGAQTTESCLLVPECREDQIKPTIQKVEEIYKKLNKWLEKEGQDLELKPIFIVHKVATYQLSAYKTLAERSLVRKIEKTFRDLRELTSKIQEVKSESKRKRILYNLNRSLRLWEDLGHIYNNLEIVKPPSYDEILNMIEKAREAVNQ
jgi:hypothetical protein